MRKTIQFIMLQKTLEYILEYDIKIENLKSSLSNFLIAIYKKNEAYRKFNGGHFKNDIINYDLYNNHNGEPYLITVKLFNTNSIIKVQLIFDLIYDNTKTWTGLRINL